MKIWVLNAFLSMLFAGVTSVMAKQGLSGISADLGLAVRTGMVFIMTSRESPVEEPGSPSLD